MKQGKGGNAPRRMTRNSLKCQAILAANVPLDPSLEISDEIKLRKKYREQVLDIAEESNLSYHELECLLVIYHKMSQLGKHSKLGIEKSLIRDLMHVSLEMTDDYLMDKIFYTLDRTSSSHMSLKKWLKCLSLYLRGTLEEKIEYCYKVYVGDKVLVREVLFDLLKNSFFSLISQEDAEETAKEMAESLILKMDTERNGKISFDDFKKAVQKQPLLLEACGQCLPAKLNVDTFLVTFSEALIKI